MTAQIEKTDLVTVTVDGVEVDVPKGTLVIRAAEQAGVQIPRFCDHPLLAPVGACRQCLVDIPDAGNGRGFPKPQASCTITVAPGMVVNTQATSEVADKAQQGIMEFLLVNHPLDCPVCDKGGECPLQNQAMSNGRGESRFNAPSSSAGRKRTYPKPINLSAQVLLDRERCVLCARCTRFSDQVAGDPGITLQQRGAWQEVNVAEGETFQSYFSGNVIQICPVGALTSADYRFRSRPFDLVSSPSIAEHDACGAAIRVDHRRGKVMRRLSGDDPEVNEEWITDKDRFGFHYATATDRLTHPLVRDTPDGELRAASWPEAFAVAARGLARARETAGVGVLTGGRLTAEDAFAYATFARVVLGTHDVDFRARPLSAEETGFLTSDVVLTTHVSYADLERAATVVLAGLEPEDEAGTLFLRLRKAVRQHGTRVVTLAPYTSAGSRKLDAHVVPTVPGHEADALDGLLGHADFGVDRTAIVLVGERLAGSPGALSAARDLAAKSGARLAWVPRRAGDRGAVETGCLPTLLPGGRPVADAAARVDAAAAWGVDHLPERPGRDTDQILAALTEHAAVRDSDDPDESGAGVGLAGLLIGGVDLDDLADPAAARAAVEAAGFVVSLELRETAVTRAADVVLPVAPVVDKAGTFVTWEGRPRSFDQVLGNPGSLPDLRVLAGIAEEAGRPLGLRTVADARRLMEQFGAWDGPRADPAPTPAPTASRPAGAGGPGGSVLATWKQLLDDGSMQAGAGLLRDTARPAVARIDAETAAGLDGDTVTLVGDRGTVTLPVEVADVAPGTVWVPARSFGRGVLADLASPGSRVTIRSARSATQEVER